MNHLVVGGVRSFAPLRNVLCALEARVNIPIHAVSLIDTPQTVAFTANTIEQIKSTLRRRDVVVTSIEVNEETATAMIPAFIAQYALRDSRAIPELVVDLTTGPKYVTSLLYAAANFCRVERIYYFLLRGQKTDVPFEELRAEDYDYLRLPPFSSQSLEALSRRSYLDMIFYLKDVEELIDHFTAESPQFADLIDRDLRAAVRDYFEDNYKGSIRNIGSLLETWTDWLHRAWISEQVVEETKPSDWAKTITALDDALGKLRRVRTGQSVPGFDQALLAQSVQLAGVGNLLNTVRVYRNLAAHKSDLVFQPDRADAKLVLDIGFAVARKSKDATFLWTR